MNVTIYTLSSCKWCTKLKEFLTKHNVEFQEKHVAHDLALIEQVYQATGQMGVPVSRIGEDWIVGYDEEKLKTILKLT